MSDKQFIAGWVFVMSWLWILSYVMGVLMPDEWFRQWYAIPFCATALLSLLAFMVLGFWIFDEDDGPLVSLSERRSQRADSNGGSDK